MLKRVMEVILCLSFMVSSVGVSFSKDRAPKTTTKAQAQKETTLAEGTLKWRYRIGHSIDSSPAIGPDGTIYVGADDGCLYAINPNGTLKWRYQTYGKISSSPAIGSDGTVYVGSEDGYFYAISPDGTLKWRYETGGEIEASPAINLDGTIYVVSNDSYLYAINSNGTLKWRYKISEGRYYRAYSPAVSSDGMTIYIACGDSLYAISFYGTLRWRYTQKDEYKGWSHEYWSVESSPVIGSDGTIYVGWRGSVYSYLADLSLESYYLYAIKPDGTLKWSSELWASEPFSFSLRGVVIGIDNALYVSGKNEWGGKLIAINPNGTLRWSYFTMGNFYSSPAIGSDGTIYVGGKETNIMWEKDDYLYAIKPKGIEATLKWRYKTDGGIWSSPAIGSDGTIYVGSWDGYLYAIQGSGKLADTPWPMFGHDLRHTGRAGK